MRWLAILLLLSTQAIADSNSMSFSLPSFGTTSGTDKIRAGDLDCSNSIGASTNFEVGMTAVINNLESIIFGNKDSVTPQTKDLGVYARIIIPIDAPKERINCNTLYQLELERRRLEVERLRQEIKFLQDMQNNGAFNN